MKSLVARTLTSVLLGVLTLGPIAQAQHAQRVIKVTVPFEFSVGNQVFPAGNYSVVSVLYDTDPSSQASEALVLSIRAMAPPDGLSVQVGGRTAEQVDFLAGLVASIPWALALIVGVMFVILFLMLGSVVVPVKLLAPPRVSFTVSEKS